MNNNMNGKNGHDYARANEQQVKNIMNMHETLQRKQLLEHRINNLANNDFSCMMKKD